MVMTHNRVAAVSDKPEERSTIGLSRRTKQALDSIKHPGQTYEGLIQELIMFWKENKNEYWIRRKEAKGRASSAVTVGRTR